MADTNPVHFRQTVEYAEHQFRISLRIVWQTDGQCVDHHLVEALGEEWFWKFPQVVLQHPWKTEFIQMRHAAADSRSTG